MINQIKVNSTENRELTITKTFRASIDLVWKAWSEPEDIADWWGPAGFTCVIHKMDFSEGGEWKLTLQGPDGTRYPNRSIFKQVTRFEKIVFEHFNPHFHTTVLFSPDGGETRMEWTMLFDTAEMRNTVIRAHRADEGLKQNIEKLEKYLLNYKANSH